MSLSIYLTVIALFGLLAWIAADTIKNHINQELHGQQIARRLKELRTL